jgi:hypothetical protein
LAVGHREHGDVGGDPVSGGVLLGGNVVNIF